jgi:catechol 2,3-dioxygenase-like lactoylglutathione lyase family enzyme
VKVLFIAGFAPIAPNPAASKALYIDLLGLPLKDQDGYLSTEALGGAKHFGVWPLNMAARSCFGSDTWPNEVPVPHATLELELASVEAVHDGVTELKARGQRFVHEARTEPWGQTVARFMSPEGLLIGLSYAPWLHENPAQGRDVGGI